MLDTDTKRRIDTARDILVGKVPDPKSQVEQITIALIYKFMDDMDAESEELGGKRAFFGGEFARYGWAKLMRSGLGGHEMRDLYDEALKRMPQNENLPALFRQILNEAYLPYRDPETLRAFLKIIDQFTYDHSERLGDAFEYLLSVLGSQGDAGQFRTPRHIIDFMVDIVDPKKDETVLDPACGTAGFLISAYKHILKANIGPHGESTLTPDDKGRLARNFTGYDISPDMVRLSLVNLYLHGFPDPHILEYDTLTSEERWNEYADVILANPPFMSPKGGIRPHNAFSVQSKRSEVLFVDYMAEHLNPGGRAAIIVPEGIIFQSQTAYKQLRKILVEQYLVAVVSLPAGVFNPYSGVKTSILFLDRARALHTDSIAFLKIEQDGFGLGAQRRTIEKNDLPHAAAALKVWLAANAEAPMPENPNYLLVPKTKIAANGDYNLSGERYREDAARCHFYAQVELGSICKPEYGFTASAEEKGDARFIRITDIGSDGRIRKDEPRFIKLSQDAEQFLLKKGDLLVARTGATFGKTMLFAEDYPAIFASYLIRLRFPPDLLLPEFYWSFAQSEMYWSQARNLVTGGGQPQFNGNALTKLQIPLPPLEVQKEIVAEIEGYQKVINGARAVLDNYRPHIPINPAWPLVELTEIIDGLESGVSVNSINRTADGAEVGILKTSCVTSGIFQPAQHKAVVREEQTMVRCPVKRNSIIISRMNTEALVGANAYVDSDYPQLFLPDRLWQTIVTRPDIEIRYVQIVLASDDYRRRISAKCGGTSGSMKNISKHQLLSLRIPLPPLETQQAIVAEIEAEQALVAANRELIARFEKKIQATLARVWGEDPGVAVK